MTIYGWLPDVLQGWMDVAPAGLIYCTEQSLATGEKRGNRG